MKQWIRGLLPLLLLGALLLLFFRFGPLGIFRAAFPPVEDLTIERIVLPRPGEMRVYVFNGGPSAVTLAQVMVDEAFWRFSLEPADPVIPRLSRRTLRIPYPWVDGEAHEVTLLTSTGLTFTRRVEVATQSPQVDWTYLSTFFLLGLYAGVIPVFLGLLWYPFLRDLSADWVFFFLSLTAGLLFFLAADSFSEALETAALVPQALQGVAVVVLGIVLTLLLLVFLSHNRQDRADKSSAEGRRWTATMIALGIGFHNLGEGLAIGSAYALGEIALGTFLVVGFTLHNVTEGLGIVTPIAQDRPHLGFLTTLGALAGLPTILGTWIGGFAYSPLWATFFLAVGTGAMLQVLYEIVRFLVREPESRLLTPHNLGGFLAGLGVMYFSGLLLVT